MAAGILVNSFNLSLAIPRQSILKQETIEYEM